MNLLQCWFHRLGNWCTERPGPAVSGSLTLPEPSSSVQRTPPYSTRFPTSEPRFSPCALEPGAALDSTFRDSLGRRGRERVDEVWVRGRTVSLIPSASAGTQTQSPAAASELAWREPRSNIPDELSGNRNMTDTQISGTHQKRGRRAKQRGWTGLRPVCH